jgi:hypothetical protein
MQKVQLSVGMLVTVRYMSRGLLVHRAEGEPTIVPIVGDDPFWNCQDVVAVLASITGHVVHATQDYVVLRGMNKPAAILHGSVRAIEIHAKSQQNGRA